MKSLVTKATHSPAYQQRVHEAWKSFIDGGEIQGRVPDHILDGWLRSRRARVDPLRVPEVPVLERRPFRELCRRFTPLLNAAAPVLDMLDSCVSGTGHIGILTAVSGHILATVGDRSLLNVARAQYNLPGADRSLETVGASAMGLALLRGLPVQICGFEHYNAGMHNWRCASAPVLADASGVLAVLTISGHVDSVAMQELALVTTLANSIGMRVRQQNIEATGQRLEALLRNAHDALGYPLLVLDGMGGITRANRHADTLFGGGDPGMPGRNVASLVGGEDAQRLRQALLERRESELSLTFLTGNGAQAFACTLTPVLGPDEKTEDMALALHPVSRSFRKARSGRTGFGHGSDGASGGGAREVGASSHTARYVFTDILGESPALRNSVDFARRAAHMASRIVIYGESGTGKELFAQAIHNAGGSAEGPFVGISCAAIPPELIETELFGYEEGAFTGARQGGRKGHLALARGGTFFLDEVNSLPLMVQSKLLRVLQEMTFSPLGGNRSLRLDARIIAASNVNLAEAVRVGVFRADLYYRLNVVEIVLPPLRERQGDVALLARLFWRQLCAGAGMPQMAVAADVMEALRAYPWPGNVRELQNICERAWVMSDGAAINLECLPSHVRREEPALAPAMPGESDGPLAPLPKSAPGFSVAVDGSASMDQLCEALVRKTLHTAGGNISKAAEMLGIARTTLYRKIRKYGVG